MKSAGKARNNGLYRHIRTSKEIIRNLLNDYYNSKSSPAFPHLFRLFALSGPKSPTKGGESVEILQKTFLFHFYPI